MENIPLPQDFTPGTPPARAPSVAFDMRQARENLRRREARRQAATHALFIQAWEDFTAITGMLVRKYNPRRIYQWGSLTREEHFSEISDIDIAVEGIGSAEKYFALYGEAMEIARLPLHLVEIEKIEPLYAELIRAKGTVVYERA
jgi:predicted nucleotidyltransferase